MLLKCILKRKQFYHFDVNVYNYRYTPSMLRKSIKFLWRNRKSFLEPINYYQSRVNTKWGHFKQQRFQEVISWITVMNHLREPYKSYNNRIFSIIGFWPSLSKIEKWIKAFVTIVANLVLFIPLVKNYCNIKDFFMILF